MNYIVDIERINHNGEGIGKINDKTIFIPKTIIGDKVEIEVVEDNKNYMRGNVLKYIDRGNKCSNPLCKYYYECGGCHISNMNYDDQLLYKENRIKNIFKRYLDKDININVLKSNNIYNYRNKITLQINNNKIGLYKNRSNDIVEIDKCLLVSDKINIIINKLKKYDLSLIKNIVIRESIDEVLLYVDGNISNDIIKIDEVDSIVINDKVIKGNGYIIQNIGEFKYIVSSNSFFQVNNDMVKYLYDKVAEYANLNKNDRVIDLYCGTGTIGIYLSKKCSEVLGIEISDSSIRDANRNISLNNINNVKFIKGDVGKIINSNYKADVIIVDPPRSGLDKKTRRVLLEMLPKRIVYVSCDTLTLARDLKELESKYKIVDVTMVDMFPQTYHCESIAVLERR